MQGRQSTEPRQNSLFYCENTCSDYTIGFIHLTCSNVCINTYRPIHSVQRMYCLPQSFFVINEYLLIAWAIFFHYFKVLQSDRAKTMV